MIQLIVIFLIILVMIVTARLQVWYFSYRREKDKREEVQSIYVMNLREREECELNRQGFIVFIRFLFLLSLFVSFLKKYLINCFNTVKLQKRQIFSNYLDYKVIRKDINN